MNTEILSVEQMRQAESLAMGGKASTYPLMQRAGRAVADIVRERYERQPVLVLCGAGNNGGDGFIAACELKRKKWDVTVACIHEVKHLDGNVALAAHEWGEDVTPFDKLDLPTEGLIIDAIYGAGLEREITGDAQEILFRLQRSMCPVIAVDVPTGLYSDTGDCQPCTPQAELTVTFFRKKMGHVLMPGRIACGEIIVTDIGIKDSVIEDVDGPLVRENDPSLGWGEDASTKAFWTHKYHHGHVVVLGGRVMTGAGSLASLSALRTGAGLVTIVAHTDVMNVYRLASPSLMVEPLTEMARFKEHLKDERRNVVLVGPGAGLDHPAALKKVVFDATGYNPQKYCVLDADALSVFEDDNRNFYKTIGEHCILTPHEGEFERIFPDYHGSKVERARAASIKTGAIIVLKGADTVIAAPDGRAVINSTGTGWLATAGTGDVLAGMIAGLVCRKVLKPFDAVCAAVWMHGKAAELAGPGMISDDLSSEIPSVLSLLTILRENDEEIEDSE
ncbi:MAG: NAD(P)H-hydrate dehydratase [Alphaproteobacteria bacterium]|nr:NAD(P)H-hydrate dehydratase [Alphaproteobacteria bacterium]